MSSALMSVPPPDSDNIWNSSNAIAFSIGSLPVAWYAIFIFMAFIVAIIFICIKLWKYYKIPIDPFYWFILIAVPCGIFGARFWSCCIGDAQWDLFFNFSSGGLAIEGGIMLVLFVGLIYFPLVLKMPKYQIRDLGSGEPQVRKISMWVYADAILPAVLIAQFIGRWGNYFNQELYGSLVTDEGLQQLLHDWLPWMYVSSSEAGGLVAGYYQPLFLWEGLMNLLGFALLFFACEFLPKKKAGDLAMGYFVWYGVLRLCMEPLRISTFSFALTYWISGLWVIAGMILIILNHSLMIKLRAYRLWFILKTSVLFYFKKIDIYFKKKSTLNKYNFAMKKNKKNDKDYLKIIDSLDELKNNSKRHYELERKEFRRNDSQMLYYFNR